jgi:3-oxoacyl-[acyl-carrier-protein] synthase-3
MNEVFISGTGMLVPDRVLKNSDLEEMVDTSDEWIIQRTGIRERRLVSDGQSTSTLATEASRRALEDAGLSARDLDAIILATITPDTQCPACAVYVQDALGATNACAFDLNAACTGFVYSTAMATGMIQSGLHQNVLVIGAEALSRFVDYTDRNTCILFGDGAGAAVLSKAPQEGANGTGSRVLDSYLRSDGARWDLISIEGGGSRHPASEETVAERLHYLRQNGKEVFKFATKTLVELITRAVTKNGIAIQDLAMVIPHQVNYRIIEAALKKIDLPRERIYLNLQRYGNTSAASVPIALSEAVQEGRIQRGDLVLLAAFGAGLTWGYNLIRW